MKIYQIDAFTSKKYSGNPAGVCIVDEFPSVEEMQNIAAEMNISETAFVKHIIDDVYKIKFFTPTEEIDLCGHATLSTAHILFELNLVSSDIAYFEANFDKVSVTKTNQSYAMDFPLWEYKKIDDIEVAQSLTGIPNIIEVFETNKKWRVVVLESKQELLNLNPNFGVMKGTEYGNVTATCIGDNDYDYDYYMRCFVTDCGINEDPVTGSIECLLAPLWCEKLNKNEMKSFQCSTRGGEKDLILKDSRVQISGKAITVFEIEVV